jgi:acetyl esterase/lipase
MALVPPPFDPELAAALEIITEGMPPVWSLDIVAEWGKGEGQDLMRVPTDQQLSRDGFFQVEERVIPGPQGEPDISLLICSPVARGGPLPVIYYTHGGGMIYGNNREAVDGALDWAQQLDAVVVSVEYRLALEHPHPAPVEDVYAGLSWVAEHAAEIGADPERIIIAGTSAGGGLTAALALLSRDRKGPRPIGQVLMCPMLDDRNDTFSACQLADTVIWNRASNEIGWTALLGERRGGPDVPAYAAPARAEDLSGLPPAFIDVGSAEIFRDEAVAYASRIWQAGGVAELHVWPGGYHGFDHSAPQAAISQAAVAARLTWLRRLLGE